LAYDKNELAEYESFYKKGGTYNSEDIVGVTKSEGTKMGQF
jgi:hypothetical protein